MQSHSSLADFPVLLTRPVHQSQSLVEKIEGESGRCILFPVIKIEPTQNLDELTRFLSKLDSYKLIIFISANAVNQVMDLMVKSNINFPQSLQVAAIGPATRKACWEHNLNVDFCPTEIANSEALLKDLAPHDWKGKMIAIFRGQDGREYLKSGLESLGATVHYIESYRRIPTQFSPAQVKQLLSSSARFVTVITSVAIFNALRSALSEKELLVVLRNPILVVSSRIASHCRQLHPDINVIVAESVDDQDIFRCIQKVSKMNYV